MPLVQARRSSLGKKLTGWGLALRRRADRLMPGASPGSPAFYLLPPVTFSILLHCFQLQASGFDGHRSSICVTRLLKQTSPSRHDECFTFGIWKLRISFDPGLNVMLPHIQIGIFDLIGV